MHYTTTLYAALCSRADEYGCVVKLSRADAFWGLQLLIPPCGVDTQWRAAGVLFPDLRELDHHAEHLLRWLRGQDTLESRTGRVP